uniref:Uncharacterized protein n=1 Tax=Siphoviridae sp. ctrCN24 TaxID=2827953 RepID=A0A8S5SKB9_9CAUD|nr:MAG TPA: Protein of unknown function (DUF1043) [Siphoviridae sp. ctrCN24]
MTPLYAISAIVIGFILGLLFMSILYEDDN